MQTKLSQNELNKFNISGAIGNEIYFFEELTSTFDKIREMDLKDGLTVVCSRQSAGSGRLGRKWESPKGGIYFTFSLLPPFNGFDIPFVTPVCALGVQKALEKYVPCEIKWPNDIVSEGKKLCGILTRNIVTQGQVNTLLVGIGINANICSFPDELYHASSLKLICKKEIDENILLAEVLEEIGKVYSSANPDVILSEYCKNCVNIEKEVTIHYADGSDDVKGICTAILPDGSMDVKTPDGIINVHSGEVSVKGIYE